MLGALIPPNGRYALLVAPSPSQDLFVCANDLFIDANADQCSGHGLVVSFDALAYISNFLKRQRELALIAIEREETAMKPIGATVLGLGTLSLLTLVSAMAQEPTVQRKVLLTQDLPIPGYQTVLAAVEIPAGGREGRHTHAGALVVYVQEGVLTFDYEGKPTMTYKAGDTLYVEPGKIHEGINKGTSPVKAIATFVIEKGKPLTSPAP